MADSVIKGAINADSITCTCRTTSDIVLIACRVKRFLFHKLQGGLTWLMVTEICVCWMNTVCCPLIETKYIFVALSLSEEKCVCMSSNLVRCVF